MSIFSREMQLALTGKLQEYVDHADEMVLKAARFAIVKVIDDQKERLRDTVKEVGLGERLANAVRGEVFPKTGLARNPAGWIYVSQSAIEIFTAFESGALIRSKDGGDLAIPIPGSPADSQHMGKQRPGETRIQTFLNRGIKLSFVPGRNGKPNMLVAENVRVRAVRSKRGPAGRERVTSAKELKSGGYAAGAATVPLFWLVPQAKMPKRLDWSREFERVTREFMKEFAAAFSTWLAILESNRRAA